MSIIGRLIGVEDKLTRTYRRLFFIDEIEQSAVLQWALGALLLALFVTFNRWADSDAISVSTAQAGRAICWPYFQGCDSLYFLQSLPYYTQSTLYALFFGIILLAIYFMWKRQWVYAHQCVLMLFLWKAFVMFVLTAELSLNYDYYDIVLGFVILFLPHKEVFAKIAFVALYFLAGTIKIHEGWIAATYFTTLVGGMPWIANSLAPLATNIVIFEQIVGSWFLLSRRMFVQRLTLAFFIFFHLYSIALVTYRYPATALTILLILFGPLYRHTSIPLDRKAIAGWAFIAIMFVLQFIPIVLIDDHRWTLETNQYGLNMFEANHQCRSKTVLEMSDGKQVTSLYESQKAWDRCNPYPIWLWIHRYCESRQVTKARWTFDHSINGHPFYRIIDLEDACLVDYNPLAQNEWIISPFEGAAAVGRPLKNPYGPAIYR